MTVKKYTITFEVESSGKTYEEVLEDAITAFADPYFKKNNYIEIYLSHKGKATDYLDEVSRPTLDAFTALVDSMNKYLAEPKEARIAKYKAWLKKGLDGNG